jgi:hypothetical protein
MKENRSDREGRKKSVLLGVPEPFFLFLITYISRPFLLGSGSSKKPFNGSEHGNFSI